MDPTLDASFDELANVHPPEVTNTVLVIAPPHTSFREANYAAALFRFFSEVKHYQSGPRVHYKFVYDNRESAIIADNSVVDPFSFKYYDATLTSVQTSLPHTPKENKNLTKFFSPTVPFLEPPNNWKSFRKTPF